MPNALSLFTADARQTKPSTRIGHHRRHTAPSGHRRPTALPARTICLLGLILLAGTARASEIMTDYTSIVPCSVNLHRSLRVEAEKARESNHYSYANYLLSEAERCRRMLLQALQATCTVQR